MKINTYIDKLNKPLYNNGRFVGIEPNNEKYKNDKENIKDIYNGDELDLNNIKSWELIIENIHYHNYNIRYTPTRVFSYQHVNDILTECVNKYHKYIMKPEFRDYKKWFKNIQTNINNIDNYYMKKIKVNNPNAKVIFIGDIHGSIQGLVSNIIKLNSIHNAFKDNTLRLNQDYYIFFTGDIVDYGGYGLESLILILTLINLNPNQVFLCDGNHEDKNFYYHNNSTQYNLFRELRYKYPISTNKGGNSVGIYQYYAYNLINYIDTIFKYSPTVIILNYNNNNIQINHGAIIPTIDDHSYYRKIIQFMKNDNLLYCHLSDGDPNRLSTQYYKGYKYGDISLYQDNIYLGRPLFSNDSITKYLTETNITSIISGHQDVTPFGIITKNGNTNIPLSTSENLTIDDSEKGYKFPHFNSKKEYNEDSYNLEFDINEINCIIISNATNSKNILYSSYLILSNDEDTASASIDEQPKRSIKQNESPKKQRLTGGFNKIKLQFNLY